MDGKHVRRIRVQQTKIRRDVDVFNEKAIAVQAIRGGR